MIDFHNHIIPNLDDGSKSIDMSINMLKEAQAQGITDIINTVHYQHPKMENKNTSYDFIITEINKLQKIINDHNINIKIHPASEVFFKFNLTEILDNPITTFGNRKYMLIEFQRLSFPEGYQDEIFKIQLKGITPIIAHPERYRSFQIDCASIIGGFGKETQKTAIELLENGLCHLIGSDAHNDKNRNFFLKQTLLEVENIIGEDSAKIIQKNSHKVLIGDPCLSYSPKIQNKSIFNKIISFIRNN